MHIEGSSRRRRSLVSLTPLIDVVFILLVFFMLATSFLDWRSIVVDVPADGGGEAGEPTAIVVRIGADGALELDGAFVRDTAALEQAVRAELAREPGRLLIVRPDDSVRLQRITQVVERVQAAGAMRMRLDRGD
ncbi:MAG: biopolymer transporter ExbD [Ectothiorhodospiraceae bacterium]|nr:biopolymer transporter ExbD [Ectothiorhodospiraceae bacterium]